MQVRAGLLLPILVTLGYTTGHPVAEDHTLAGHHAQTVTQTTRTLTDTTDRLESLSDSIETEVNTNREADDGNISTEAVRVAEKVVPVESATESESNEQNPDHQFSISDQVNSFADFSLHPSAVIFTVSNFTTNNPLDNLKDFSNWNASDIHDFQLNHENDIEGNEFSYIDQLAVESEHRSNTVAAHSILANDTHESGTYNVSLSTATTYSEEVTRVWVTTTLDSSTPLSVEEEMEEEMSSTPKYFSTGVNPSRAPELADIQESQLQVTHDQPHDHPLAPHHDTTPHPHTPGVLDVEEVHNQGTVKVEEYNFDDHFDLVTVDKDDKSDHADLDRDSAYAVSDNEPVQSTALYNSDLYEVVTSQINPESEIFVDSREEFSVYEYENEDDKSDVVIHSNSSQDESEDINEKYASFLDNLKNKYEVASEAEDGNREHSPKLFEDSLAVLVNTKDSSPKLFDRGLPSHNREESLESSPPDRESVVDTSPVVDSSPMTEMGHPLVSLMKIEPHAMKLLVKPRKFEPDTMVRLMYERVPRDKPALQQHLDDPVIEYVHVYRVEQEHYLTNLPMGKYIVCGEAQINGEVFQSNCFETSINRLDNNMLQGGVIAVIAVALLIVFCVILYAIYHRVVVSKKKDMERILQEKVAKFARKEKEIYEKELYEVPVFAVTYPDPTEPYEERCIM